MTDDRQAFQLSPVFALCNFWWRMCRMPRVWLWPYDDELPRPASHDPITVTYAPVRVPPGVVVEAPEPSGAYLFVPYDDSRWIERYDGHFVELERTDDGRMVEASKREGSST